MLGVGLTLLSLTSCGNSKCDELDKKSNQLLEQQKSTLKEFKQYNKNYAESGDRFGYDHSNTIRLEKLKDKTHLKLDEIHKSMSKTTKQYIECGCGK